MKHPTKKISTPPRLYLCSACGRRLKTGHWIYSKHTGSRYCYVGEGCNK